MSAPRGASATSQGGGFAVAFAKHVGNDWKTQLTGSFTSAPVVVLAGQQCTGKSTAAEALAAKLGRPKSGTGALVRQAAAAQGMPVEKFVGTIDAATDVALDFRAAKVIGEGAVATFESRLAGHLAQMLRGLGRKNVVSVFLTASPREQALRWVQREVSPEAARRVAAGLPVDAGASLAKVLDAIVALGDPEVSDELAPLVQAVGARDEIDRQRLLGLYGVDYQDASAFDVVVVTDGKSPQQVQDEIWRAVSSRVQQGDRP